MSHEVRAFHERTRKISKPRKAAKRSSSTGLKGTRALATPPIDEHHACNLQGNDCACRSAHSQDEFFNGIDPLPSPATSRRGSSEVDVPVHCAEQPMARFSSRQAGGGTAATCTSAHITSFLLKGDGGTLVQCFYAKALFHPNISVRVLDLDDHAGARPCVRDDVEGTVQFLDVQVESVSDDHQDGKHERSHAQQVGRY